MATVAPITAGAAASSLQAFDAMSSIETIHADFDGLIAVLEAATDNVGPDADKRLVRLLSAAIYMAQRLDADMRAAEREALQMGRC